MTERKKLDESLRPDAHSPELESESRPFGKQEFADLAVWVNANIDKKNVRAAVESLSRQDKNFPIRIVTLPNLVESFTSRNLQFRETSTKGEFLLYHEPSSTKVLIAITDQRLLQAGDARAILNRLFAMGGSKNLPGPHILLSPAQGDLLTAATNDPKAMYNVQGNNLNRGEISFDLNDPRGQASLKRAQEIPLVQRLEAEGIAVENAEKDRKLKYQQQREDQAREVLERERALLSRAQEIQIKYQDLATLNEQRQADLKKIKPRVSAEQVSGLLEKLLNQAVGSQDKLKFQTLLIKLGYLNQPQQNQSWVSAQYLRDHYESITKARVATQKWWHTMGARQSIRQFLEQAQSQIPWPELITYHTKLKQGEIAQQKYTDSVQDLRAQATALLRDMQEFYPEDKRHDVPGLHGMPEKSRYPATWITFGKAWDDRKKKWEPRQTGLLPFLEELNARAPE